MKKLTAKVLCACMLMTSCPVYTNVAHADREEVIEQNEELDNVDVKTNKQKKEVEIVKIPQGHAYIPKGTVLNMEFFLLIAPLVRFTKMELAQEKMQKDMKPSKILEFLVEVEIRKFT